jgi:hypothetical protein
VEQASSSWHAMFAMTLPPQQHFQQQYSGSVDCEAGQMLVTFQLPCHCNCRSKPRSELGAGVKSSPHHLLLHSKLNQSSSSSSSSRLAKAPHGLILGLILGPVNPGGARQTLSRPRPLPHSLQARRRPCDT